MSNIPGFIGSDSKLSDLFPLVRASEQRLAHPDSVGFRV